MVEIPKEATRFSSIQGKLRDADLTQTDVVRSMSPYLLQTSRQCTGTYTAQELKRPDSLKTLNTIFIEIHFFRGKLDPNAPALSSAPVKKFGLQAAGGVYEAEKQSGVGVLEIDWIK